MGGPTPFTLGICAYNEAANIERAIRSVYGQVLDGLCLKETVVVSSGSSDGTDGIVDGLMKEYRSLRLIRQEAREGKNSAVNCFLDGKSTEIVVILNADTIFADENSLQRLLEPFEDSGVGIVGGHPIPTNDKRTIAGYASHMIWMMHHNISMMEPKIGEIIAFREIGTRLSVKNSGDEDALKMRLEEAGYRSVYVSDAKVFNKGPETIRDFVKQRTRVNIGESSIKMEHGFDIPTRKIKRLYPAFTATMKELGFHPIKMVIATSLETYSRIRARLHVRLNKGDISVWDPVRSTKRP
ncbi:MAG: glycosyltransferase [Candidatus Methanoplasma sp.]|jgi:cellulose synthase/poly-beta-1,6-N-acetylglucosamine synthase-like glycosyltransferase|nr:glycosyltransferase [Candidatus Methanoplasma sp.]